MTLRPKVPERGRMVEGSCVRRACALHFSMTSRQRLLAAIRRMPVDRVPVTLYELHDFGGSWAAAEPSYRPLLDLQASLGDTFVPMAAAAALLSDPNRIQTGAQLAEREGVTRRRVETPHGPLTSVSRSDPGIVTTWTLKHFIETDEDIERFLSIPYQFTPPDAEETHRLASAAGDRGLPIFSIGDPLGVISGLCDFGFFVTRIAPDAGLAGELLDRANRFLEDTIDWIGERYRDVCVRFWGPEYSGAPLMDPRRFFRPLVLERLAPLVARTHAAGNLAVVHCHGRLDALLEMILETGADVLEPLEVLPASTADVSIADVKRRAGHRMCLAGGLQAADLDMGTPAIIRQRVREILTAAGPRGLILLPTSTPLQVPLPRRVLENYRAMFEAAAEGAS